jgi:hypothetical protein
MEGFEGATEAPNEGLENGTTTTETQSTQPDPQTGQPIDIDTQADRYRYKGRPISEYESGYMRQQDYTQKTTQLAQERKYYDNLSFDLDRVRSNPALAEQFKSIYPEKFHGYLRYVQENSADPSQGNQRQLTQQERQYARLDPAMEMRINNLEKTFRDKEVAAISAELDSKFKSYSQKYPFADEEAVVARAQALLSKMKEMDPLNGNITISDKQWDALWKSTNDRVYQLSDSRYKDQVKRQIQAGRSSADTGRGGGIAGQAPRQFKTMKEATAAALADIESGTF